LFDSPDSCIPAIGFLHQAINFLAGGYRHALSPETVSVKWDGAPAFVFGTNPENGKFFVGTKSVFSGKVNYTPEDIDVNHPKSEGLRQKLKWLLEYLPKTECVYQADLLWWQGNCIPRDGYFGFKANTLTYFPQWDCKWRESVNNILLGASVHTVYTEGMNIDVFRKIPFEFLCGDVLLINPRMEEKRRITQRVEDILRKELEQPYIIDTEVLGEFTNPELNKILKLYTNSCVRRCTTPEAEEFLWFLTSYYGGKETELRTQKAIDNVREKKEYYQNNLPPEELGQIFNLYNRLARIKNEVIEHLDKVKDVQVFLPDGTACGHEGYVFTTATHNMVKFVNRHVFSRANMMNDNKEWKDK
jgi:hypothetical protein